MYFDDKWKLQWMNGVGFMKKYTIKVQKDFMKTEEVVIMARDRATAEKIAKVIVEARNK